MKQMVRSILHELGPSLSSEIVARLCAEGVTCEAARQRVCRAGRTVNRLRSIRFPNRETFLFLSNQFGTKEFQDRLAGAMKTTGSAYGRALLGIEARGGVLSDSDFPIASGLPVY